MRESTPKEQREMLRNLIFPDPLRKIKDLSTEDLKKLRQNIDEELKDREALDQPLPLKERERLDKLVLENSPLPDLGSLEADKPLELMKKAFINMVKGTSPNFTIFDDPMVSKCGSYNGSYGTWSWKDSELERLTEEELWSLYNLCVKSYE